METRIRPATIGDLFWLRLLLGQVIATRPEAYPTPTKNDLETQTAVLASRLGADDPSLLCFLAEQDEVCCGFVLGDLYTRMGHPHVYAFISFLYVVPGMQGHGIGQALSTAVIKEAKELGAEALEFTSQLGDGQWTLRGWPTVATIHSLPIDGALASVASTKVSNGHGVEHDDA